MPRTRKAEASTPAVAEATPEHSPAATSAGETAAPQEPPAKAATAENPF